MCESRSLQHESPVLGLIIWINRILTSCEEKQPLICVGVEDIEGLNFKEMCLSCVTFLMC